MCIPVSGITADMVIMYSVSIDDGSSCVLRMKAGGMKVSWFLIQCAGDVTTAVSHWYPGNEYARYFL